MWVHGIVSLLLLCAVPVTAQTFTKRTWTQSLQLANQLVVNLTQAEKVGIVTGQGQFVAHCIGNTHAVNRSLPNAPNGLPTICLNDGPAGVRAVDLVTGFPAGINAASTFSRRLINARGKALGEEFRGKGINVFLGPAMDLMRSPKAGRGWESFGPDPWLNGEAAFETIQGVQSVGVQAVAKHFLANIQEHYRYTYSTSLDDRTIHELYLWPFLRSIEAEVSSVMCAYNQFNGSYSCGNPQLLNLLKANGFQGFVLSDWGATHPTTEQYANAGLDMEQPGDFILIGGGIYGGNLQAANNNGEVSTARLNEMVANVVASWFRLGQDVGYPAPNFNALDTSSPLNQHVNVRSDAHTTLAKEVATASSVLLKNTNGALPLKGTEKTMAIIGLDAKAPQTGCNLNACNGGTVVTGWGSGTISYDFVVPPIDALNQKAATTGTKVTSSLSNDLDAAAATAKGKDVAIVFVNAMSGELGALQQVDLNFGDRNNMALWNDGGSMVERVAAVNNNTVVIIHSTGPVLMGPWGDFPNVTAMIYAGAPGEQTGPAIVDVLYGAVNPSGRLPFTIAVNEDDYPADILYFDFNVSPTIAFPETLFLDYRHFDQANITPRYEFGFGLSYTTFGYSGLSISASSSGVSISFTVTNSGSRDGTEIPQFYLGFPSGTGEPPKVLRGFDEVILPKGQSNNVTLSLNQRDISIWNTPSQSWVRPSGTFKVFVGASSRDIRLQGSFTL